MLPRATKNSALRPSRSNSGWANASAHSPPRCSAASRKPIEPLTLAQDKQSADGLPEPEEARGGAHVLIAGAERPDRADAERAAARSKRVTLIQLASSVDHQRSPAASGCVSNSRAA